MDQQKHFLYFILTGFLGIAVLIPFINFASAISVGDQGLNFYAFQQVANGATPYKDFWWGYGPLAPYYYGGFYKFCGGTMASIFLGRMLLIFLTGMCLYLTLACFVPPLLALSTSLWFWIYKPDFFYSYNHTGALTLFLAISYFLFAYYKTPKKSHVYYGFICLFLLCLIRINMGLALLFGFVAVLYLTDRFIHKRDCKTNLALYFTGASLICILSMLIYWLMLKDLPMYAIHQCMPYFNKVYRDGSHVLKYMHYFGFILKLITQSIIYFGFFVLLLGSFFGTCLAFKRPAAQGEDKQSMKFSLAVILFLILIVSHEFILGFQPYRVIWTIPYQMVFFALIIHFGTLSLKKSVRCLIIFFVLAVATADTFKHNMTIQRYKKDPLHFIHLKRANVYIGNRQPWIRTVESTTNYLNAYLKKDEQFFALPYEPIYYYLTDRKSPSWHTLLMQGSDLTKEQEAEMIAAVKKLNYVVLSNRYRSVEPRLGQLGETHLIDLSAYINDHFQTVVTYGFWDAEPGWNVNHGLKILKRIKY